MTSTGARQRTPAGELGAGSGWADFGQAVSAGVSIAAGYGLFLGWIVGLALAIAFMRTRPVEDATQGDPP